MCGICGQYNFKDQVPVKFEDIQRMTKTMIHRGPDDEGFYLSGPLGFGFRRLSIIDLEGGHQPMSDLDESVWVVFNGEIYNFQDLKRELENQGHVFRTKSDTEVIIHGYKQWGDDVFNHLNGMFGLAIWDVKRRRLLIARDPMGIKVVYYKIAGGTVYFGSEIRPILAATGEHPEIEPVSLNLFLRFRYTPSPLTVFKGIKKLAPGSVLIFEYRHSHLERWYRYSPTPIPTDKTSDQAAEELLDLYKRAVKRQLMSDVPVGLLLSGGIDSGLLLGLMTLNGSTWPTYSVGYGEHSYKDDELRDAARTAELFSARNNSIELSRSAFEATLPKIISCLEEPIASSSIVPMYFVCERARKDVKVALVGQGPDELFGGYRRHLGIRYGAVWRGIPEWMQIALTYIINTLPRNETLKRGVYSLNIRNRMKRYQHVFSILPAQTIDGLFQDGLLPRNPGDKVLECWDDIEPLMKKTDELGGFQFLEIRSSLPDELLMYADKLSMAHNLEVRVPYLDREIVEYVERLPADFKIRNGIRKWLHRRVCRKFLPNEIMKRKKRGFAVDVVANWFRDSMGNKMDNYLLDPHSLMFQYLKSSVVQKLFKEHRSGLHDHHKILFSLVVFEEWLRTNIRMDAATTHISH
jgi:asparagine synthase (glutamine-hydrolysing)